MYSILHKPDSAQAISEIHSHTRDISRRLSFAIFPPQTVKTAFSLYSKVNGYTRKKQIYKIKYSDYNRKILPCWEGFFLHFSFFPLFPPSSDRITAWRQTQSYPLLPGP